MTLRVFLAGEGRHELGRWYDPAYADASKDAEGAVAALLKRVRSDGWEVAGARAWKDIKHYRAGEHRSPETRTVLGLALLAVEARCSLLAFVRDSDGRIGTIADVDAAISDTVLLEIAPDLRVVGGCADPVLEAWVLVFDGLTDAESWRKARVLEEAERRGLNSTEAMTRVIDSRESPQAPKDGHLAGWLNRAEAAFAAVSSTEAKSPP
jgi:hypothetical protein